MLKKDIDPALATQEEVAQAERIEKIVLGRACVGESKSTGVADVAAQ